MVQIPQPGIIFVRADTSRERPADRAEFWNEVVRKQVVELECRTDAGRDLLCTLDGFSCSAGSANAIRVGKMSVRRLVRAVDSEPSDAVVLNLLVRGEMHVAQLGNEGVLRPGDFSICVADRPYELQIPVGMQIASFRIPVEQMGCNRTVLKRLAARTFSGESGMAPLVRAYVLALMKQRMTANAKTADAAMRQLGSLLGATAQEALQESSVQRTEHRERLVLQARYCVDRNIDSDELSAASVAAEMRVSTRHLQRLWANEEDSLADYIARRRLERVTASLSNPARSMESLTQIAMSHGFVNMSHFSRVFRESHGMSPSAFRQRAAIGSTAIGVAA
ncbi:helix-turn-helix domain-containing protein [Variovorax sp. J31P207]|uniref:helix-turn-helix domain-containing protein n=1 Tax=Variovorax sp. J31P207 TaxID=3053510 RepID=UPI002577D5D1|nr:helix-turn-helix domain-containing protein [Variovorax sp. J31P207]MDM0067262.1 helix-turn-helix domain-containing protein [Variovorax sp. J31P207]